MLALLAQLDARRTGDQEVAGLTHIGSQHSYIEIVMKYFLFSLAAFLRFEKESCLFLETECLFLGTDTMCTILVRHLED